MRREDLYVADLVDTTRAIRGYLGSVSRAKWDEDRVLRDAVLYRLLLLGEIASALPESLRDRYPDVAWRHIRAFRNLAVHRYFVVDWAVVWQISQEEVPVLEEQVMGIMRAEFPELARTYEPDTALARRICPSVHKHPAGDAHCFRQNRISVSRAEFPRGFSITADWKKLGRTIGPCLWSCRPTAGWGPQKSPQAHPPDWYRVHQGSRHTGT